VRVRQRRPDDLPELVEALRAVHERDGYPVVWKADPAAWLSPAGLQGAWVAERAGRPAGHAALAKGTLPGLRRPPGPRPRAGRRSSCGA
jgi:hypothetical protein